MRMYASTNLGLVGTDLTSGLQQRTASVESVGGHGEMHPEASEPSWASEAGSVSRRTIPASHLAVHFEGDEVVEISDISTLLDSDHHLDRI